jgi:mycoredoxin
MLRRWGLAGTVLVIGFMLAGSLIDQSLIMALFIGVAYAGMAIMFSPLAFPRSLTAVDAQHRSAADGLPVIYWRPGCRYCLRLRFRLGRAGARAHWVDIWRDPAGAAAVREVADGNETVPTVVLGGQPFVNPDPAWLRGRLQLR